MPLVYVIIFHYFVKLRMQRIFYSCYKRNNLCIFLSSTIFSKARYLAQADALITDVHNTLGKDRTLKNRLGLYSSLRILL